MALGDANVSARDGDTTHGRGFHCWLNSQLKLIEKERANPEAGRCCGIIYTALAAERRLW